MKKIFLILFSVLLFTSSLLANVYTNKLSGMCPLHSHEVEQRLSKWSGADKSSIREILSKTHKAKLWDFCKNSNPELLKLAVKFGGIDMVNFWGNSSKTIRKDYPKIEKEYMAQLKNPKSSKIYEKISGFMMANQKNLIDQINIVKCIEKMPNNLKEITSDNICILPYLINMETNQMVEFSKIIKNYSNDRIK